MSSNQAKNVVIFGATGNTGSYLTDFALSYLDPMEYAIIASGRRKTDFFKIHGVEYYSCDITKGSDLKLLPTTNIHAVLLLAATIPSYMNVYSPRKYIDSIVTGGFNVLEYCRRVGADRIIFTQTVFDVSLYPHSRVLDPSIEPFFSYTGDHAVYVIAKNAMLELIEHYHQEYGLKNFIFRLPTIYNYSPYHYYFPNGEKTLRPVYKMIASAMNGDPLEIWGDPSYAKDMVYVDDFSQMLCRAIEVDRDSGFYNVGTGIPVTLEEQVRTIIEVFSPKDRESAIVYRPEMPAGGGFLMNVENAKRELGYSPKYDCRALFECFAREMKLNRFQELRMLDY